MKRKDNQKKKKPTNIKHTRDKLYVLVSLFPHGQWHSRQTNCLIFTIGIWILIWPIYTYEYRAAHSIISNNTSTQ